MTHPVSPMLHAIASGLAVDQASWQAGYEAAIAGRRSACPAGMDLFSFYLGRAAACPGGMKAAS